jgi:hypothetical protein
MHAADEVRAAAETPAALAAKAAAEEEAAAYEAEEEEAPVAAVSDIPWCFPCKWTSGSGVEIVCASNVKKKSHHVVSVAHKTFLEKVAAEQARTQSVPDAGGAPEDSQADLVNDPLAAENLGLGSSSRPSEGSSGSESDSDSDSSVEGHAAPVAAAPVAAAAPPAILPATAAASDSRPRARGGGGYPQASPQTTDKKQKKAHPHPISIPTDWCSPDHLQQMRRTE